MLSRLQGRSMENLNKSAQERSQRLAGVLLKERTYGLDYRITIFSA